MDRAAIVASQLLNTCCSEGRQIGALPEGIRPQTREDGYAIQAGWEDFSNAPPIGWKIAATNTAAQNHLGVDAPLAGRIFREMIVEPGGVCPFANNSMKVAELEFAFVMGSTLPPKHEAYLLEEVYDAVAGLHLAIEIPDSRYRASNQVGAAQLIADNACANKFVFGPQVRTEWRKTSLARQRVCGLINRAPRGEGWGANVLGDPLLALLWLVNELSNQGMSLREGQIVSTGTCVDPMPITSGDYIEGDFGSFGSVDVKISV